MSGNPILLVENITKWFGGIRAVDNVSLSVNEGEKIAIIGRSGSGKSTFLRCINKLETIQSGTITIDGETIVENSKAGYAKYLSERELRPIIRKTGMVFQHFNLFPHLTCLQNITITGIKVEKRKEKEVIEQGMALLETVGLTDKADKYPAQISGGQKQRIAIARALALNPKIMLFDEPTSALDPEITGEVLSVIRDLANKNMTMLIVTHEMAFAREVADRIIFMEDGVMIEENAPDEFFNNPATPRLKEFLAAAY